MLELKSTIVKLLQKENRFIPKRELCEKLHIKGAKRRDLKRILRELEQEGLYVRRKTTNLSVEVHKKHIKQEKYGSKKPFLSDCQSQTYLGVVCRHGHHLFLESVDRRRPFDPIAIDPKKFDDQQKEIKIGDVLSLSLNENTENSVLKHIGSFHEAQMFSLLEIIKSGVVYEFSEQAKREAQKGKIPSLKGRKDYRQIPLVTIDGVDARDFDDAVFAKPDDTPDNPKGWYVIVAIADVAHYVKSGGILDQEAYARGNSIYFPDRVVPMLPEALSNEMCSLKAGEDRACLAVEMRISKKGDLLSFEFHRGLMRSHHRLTYENVQQFLDQEKKIFDTPCDQTLWDQILDPLYGVYQVLQKKTG